MRPFRLGLVVPAIIGSFGAPNPSQAYVKTVDDQGTPIHWPSPVKFNLRGNPINQVGLSPELFREATVKGLQRWEAAAAGSIHFDYWQGVDPQTYPADSEMNGISSIYFASNHLASNPHSSKHQDSIPSNVLGLTQVWYSVDSGEIYETDIELNDLDFHFTNDPMDTSGFGSEEELAQVVNSSEESDAKSPGSVESHPRVYLQNVMTHELGHALGLSHSGGLQSTMLFMESPEQAHLGCDEMIGIHALYPSSDQSQRGILQGQIVSKEGTPVFGAHVLAISQARGTVLATALTEPNGYYQISALEPGTYYLMAEPFYAGPQALPNYYSKINPRVCPNDAPFARSFLTTPHTIQLMPVKISTSHLTVAPTLEVHCDSLVSAPHLTSLVLDSPHSGGIADGIPTSAENRRSTADQNTYRLEGVSGDLTLHAMAYSLYSPVHLSLSLETPQGEVLPSQIQDPIYRGDSGYLNRDSALHHEHLPAGDYIVRVTSQTLTTDNFPAGPVALDNVPFLVLTVSLNDSYPPTNLGLPFNARCRTEENFAPYQTPLEIPFVHAPKATSTSDGGGCGTIRFEKTTKKNQSDPWLRIAWFVPWGLMALVLWANRYVIYLRRRVAPYKLKG